MHTQSWAPTMEKMSDSRHLIVNNRNPTTDTWQPGANNNHWQRHTTITTTDTWQPGTNYNHTDTQVKNNHITDSYTWKSKQTPDIWQPETNCNHRRHLKITTTDTWQPVTKTHHQQLHLRTQNHHPTTERIQQIQIKRKAPSPAISCSRQRHNNNDNKYFPATMFFFSQCQEFRLQVLSKHWTKSSKNLSRNLLHGDKNSRGVGWIFLFLSIWKSNERS